MLSKQPRTPSSNSEAAVISRSESVGQDAPTDSFEQGNASVKPEQSVTSGSHAWLHDIKSALHAAYESVQSWNWNASKADSPMITGIVLEKE